MTDLPAASWINLALQIPLALVIVFLVIKFLSFIQDNTKQFLNFMQSQQEMNRNQMKESLSRLAEEIKADKTDMLKEVSNLTQRVDSVIDKAIMLERLIPEKTRQRRRE